jgi:phenylacetic acid degradation operon negative regulatory protein
LRPIAAPTNMNASRRSDISIASWIRRDLEASPPKARSLVVTVWGDAIAPHGGTVWLSGLIRLMQPLGMSERLVRTSVYRLGQQGWLTANQDGRRSLYALTRHGIAQFEDASKRIYASPAHAWNGTWQMAVLPPALTENVRKMLRKQLAWDGYAVLAPGVFVRPARPERATRGNDTTTRVAERGNVTTLIACERAPAIGHSLASMALASWNLQGVAAEYRAFIARFTPVIRAFSKAPASPEHSFAVRMLLIHAYRRATLHDPRLPSDLLPTRWPAMAAYTLCGDFYRLTHKRAEEHLMTTLQGERGPLPPSAPYFRERFGGLA